MALILYTTKKEPASEKLIRVIETLISEEKLEIYESTVSLHARLRQPRNEVEIAVLAAADRHELSDIVSLRDFLIGVRTIIILPDREPDTASKAHTLLPRFLTYFDDGFEALEAVLRKMLMNSKFKE